MEPCEARKVRVVVEDAPEFASYWARPYIGEERDAVEVTYDGRTFYLDDELGQGWAKVTSGGSPRTGHKNLAVSNVRDR